MKVNWEHKKREAEGLGRDAVEGWEGEGYANPGSRLWHHLPAVSSVWQVRGRRARALGRVTCVFQTHGISWF